jgi:ribosome-associated toxin RatA of RatAB toxin-antitoxin module
MRTAKVEAELSLSIDHLWSLLLEISNYPKYIKFLQKAELVGGRIEVGAVWYDWTTILFLPMKIKHTVVSITPKEEIGFDVDLIFGGIMQQRFVFSPRGSSTQIQGQISFDFRNKLVDKILGQFLQKRLQEMLEGSLENFKKENNGRVS